MPACHACPVGRSAVLETDVGVFETLSEIRCRYIVHLMQRSVLHWSTRELAVLSILLTCLPFQIFQSSSLSNYLLKIVGGDGLRSPLRD